MKKETLTQGLLFEIPAEDNVGEMRRWMHMKLNIDPWWFPSAKQFLEISDRFKVRGRRPLEIYEELRWGTASKSCCGIQITRL